ncbi:MAG: PH domain-containing protein [Chloroflexaceae bacterium]|nr:PH domain-containing protein [Chloroflexaceae bacterium]
MSGVPAPAFDIFNFILAIALIVALLGSFFAPQPESPTKGPYIRQLLWIAALVFAGLIFYRFFLGGRVFYLDPAAASSTATFLDLPNIILMLITVIAIISAGLIYVECENDHLILTNKRVILSDREILGRYKVDQISIEDIQDVQMQSDTYIAHWMHFGNITVTSASQARRAPLVFYTAEHANEMLNLIMKEVKACRGALSDAQFQRMVQAEVYGEKVETARPRTDVKAHRTPPILRRLVPENPEIKEDGTITWRRHWLFLALALLRPLTFIFVAFVAIFFVASFELLPTIWITGLTIAVIIVFLGWMAYEIEDYRNDKYILSPSNIEDIEQLPWGPSNKRTAGLGAIQNVTENTTLISRWFGYGDIQIETAGASGKFTFPKIPDPKNVLGTINNYRDVFKRDEKKRSLQDTLKLMRTYHSATRDIQSYEALQKQVQDLSEHYAETNQLNQELVRYQTELTRDVALLRSHFLEAGTFAAAPPPPHAQAEAPTEIASSPFAGGAAVSPEAPTAPTPLVSPDAATTPAYSVMPPPTEPEQDLLKQLLDEQHASVRSDHNAVTQIAPMPSYDYSPDRTNGDSTNDTLTRPAFVTPTSQRVPRYFNDELTNGEPTR